MQNWSSVNRKISFLQHILRDKRVIDYAQDIADSVPLPETKVTEATKMTRSKAKLFGQQPLLTALETTKPKSVSLLILSYCLETAFRKLLFIKS